MKDHKCSKGDDMLMTIPARYLAGIDDEHSRPSIKLYLA